MAYPVQSNQGVRYTHITATTVICGGPCQILGIFVASCSATPTIQVTDAANDVANTFTPSGATFYPLPAQVITNLVVTISGTVDCTVFWNDKI